MGTRKMSNHSYTDKKETQIFLTNKEIQMGSGALPDRRGNAQIFPNI
jgi:hypothetical protein